MKNVAKLLFISVMGIGVAACGAIETCMGTHNMEPFLHKGMVIMPTIPKQWTIKIDERVKPQHRKAIMRAARTWNQGMDVKVFVDGGVTDPFSQKNLEERIAKAPELHITCDHDWSMKGVYSHMATTYLRKVGEHPYQAVIFMNCSRFGWIDWSSESMSLVDWTTASQHIVDVESVMIHELGHVLGLLHSRDPDSVMIVGHFFDYKDQRQVLSYDDINEALRIYHAEPVLPE